MHNTADWLPGMSYRYENMTKRLDRGRGIVNDADREFIAYPESTEESRPRQRRLEIRKRIQNSLGDAPLLAEKLDARDRKLIFENYTSTPDNPESPYSPDTDGPTLDGYSDIEYLIAFLYLGLSDVTDEPDDAFRRGIWLAETIRHGRTQEGTHTVDVNLDLDVQVEEAESPIDQFVGRDSVGLDEVVDEITSAHHEEIEEDYIIVDTDRDWLEQYEVKIQSRSDN